MGRRRAYGPVAGHRQARLLRIGGYAAMLALVLVKAAVERVADAPPNNLSASGLAWTGEIAFLAVMVGYAVVILACTARRSPAATGRRCHRRGPRHRCVPAGAARLPASLHRLVACAPVRRGAWPWACCWRCALPWRRGWQQPGGPAARCPLVPGPGKAPWPDCAPGRPPRWWSRSCPPPPSRCCPTTPALRNWAAGHIGQWTPIVGQVTPMVGISPRLCGGEQRLRGRVPRRAAAQPAGRLRSRRLGGPGGQPPARLAPPGRVGTDRSRHGRQVMTAPRSRPLLAALGPALGGGLLACCAILVAVSACSSPIRPRPDGLDHAVDAPIIAWLDGHHGLAAWLVSPGSQLPAAALSAVMVIGCLLTGRLNGAVLAAAAVPAAVGVNDGLCKPLFHRTYLGSCPIRAAIPPRVRAGRDDSRPAPRRPAAVGDGRVRSGCDPGRRLLAGDRGRVVGVIGYDGTTSPIPWPAPRWVSGRCAGWLWFWICRSSGAG